MANNIWNKAITLERIADALPDGTLYNAIGILKTAQVKTASNGKPYLTGELMDKSGTIPVIMWDYSGGLHENEGCVVRILAQGKEFSGKRQLNISDWEIPDTDTYEMEKFLPMAPVPPEAYDRLVELAEGLDEPYNRLTCEMLRRAGDILKYLPAAKSMHHSQLGGLLMHTYNMTRVAACVAKIYPQVNRSLLISGCILHDIGKIGEFETNEFGIITDYTVRGNLIGHLIMGTEELLSCAKALDLESDEAVLLLQHMLLSHHGEPEWGACVQPQTLEAIILSQIDLLDARIESVTETFNETLPGTVSEYNRALQRRLYCPTDFGKN